MNTRSKTFFIMLLSITIPLLTTTLVVRAELSLSAAQEFATWQQVNEDGFGEAANDAVLSLEAFGGQIYAGTSNDAGAQLWRKTGAGAWASVSLDGLGDSDNTSIADLFEYGGNLYAGTRNEADGGQMLRSADGAGWDSITLPGFDPTNGEIVHFTSYNSQIFASTWSFSNTHGAEVWQSSTGDTNSWTQVVSDGFDGDADNEKIVTFETFGGDLFAGTDNAATGAEVWVSSEGTSWSQVNADGFGDPYNWSVTLEAFDGYLYAGTYNYTDSDNPGAELWRCQVCDGSDWQELAVPKGFGDTENRAIRSLIQNGDALYAVTSNASSGIEVWVSTTGLSWAQVNTDGFGDSSNTQPYWDNAAAVYENSLYVGTSNSSTGGEVWQMLPHNAFLPIVMKPEELVGCDVPLALYSPADNSSLDTLVPLFTWEPTNDPRATRLHMNVATDPLFSNTYTGLSAGTSKIEHRYSSNFAPATTYYWRVWLECEAGPGPYSEVRSFTAGSGGVLLPAPVLIAPLNGSAVTSTQVTLQWSPVAGAVEYLMSWRPVGETYRIISTITDTQKTASFSPGTTHEWWITARNDYAFGAESDYWRFTTPGARSSACLLTIPSSGWRSMRTPAPRCSWTGANKPFQAMNPDR